MKWTLRAVSVAQGMPLASDYPFADVMWTMLVFFAWVLWVALVIMILIDNFHRTDASGWSKAGWTLLVIFLPLVGVLAYMVVQAPDRPVSA